MNKYFELAELIFTEITERKKNLEKRYPKRDLKEGLIADIAVLDIENEQVYDKENIVSKGKNSPFIGKKYYGFNTLTIVGGKIVYKK